MSSGTDDEFDKKDKDDEDEDEISGRLCQFPVSGESRLEGEGSGLEIR
jgi:hypothetical protein